jgi:hypothetical protein
MMSLLGFSPAPFSTVKFVACLVGLMAIAGLSYAPLVLRPPEQVTVSQDVFDLVRFSKPVEEVRDMLPTIGIPWFLRRAGVKGLIDTSDPVQMIMTLVLEGQIVGRYIERVEPIDPDRSRLYVAWAPADMTLVQRLAAPIDTSLDPASLMRVTLAEHIRSSLDGGGFQLGVLKPGALRSILSGGFGGTVAHPRRVTDDFPLEAADKEAAAIRRAYRAEAERAGAAAPGL